jgi:hypothetical protein
VVCASHVATLSSQDFLSQNLQNNNVQQVHEKTNEKKISKGTSLRCATTIGLQFGEKQLSEVERKKKNNSKQHLVDDLDNPLDGFIW